MIVKRNKVKTKVVKPPLTDWIGDLSWANHGGKCCGRQHLFAFDDVDLQPEWEGPELSHRDKVEGLRQYIKENWPSRPGVNRGLGVEVVLADYQLGTWSRALTAVGFRRVFTFRNENSGNACYVYMLDTSKLK